MYPAIIEELEDATLRQFTGSRRERWEAYAKSNVGKNFVALIASCGLSLSASKVGTEMARLYKVLSTTIHRYNKTDYGLEVMMKYITEYDVCLLDAICKKAGYAVKVKAEEMSS